MNKGLALVCSEITDDLSGVEIKETETKDPTGNEVLIKVKAASVNFPDLLMTQGKYQHKPELPFVLGMEGSGVIQKTGNIVKDLKEGDEVTFGSWGTGAFSEFIKVPDEWIIKKPSNLSLSESMAFGTAGLTAGLCLRKLLQHGLKPDDGKVFVSGVTGGVGIISLMLFSKLGFEVTAITGKMNERDLLIDLGANEVIDRNDLDVDLVSPLQKPIYSGGIDAVGGKILSNLICSTTQRAAIACCGMVGGLSLDTSIFPFILRGLSLFGIDSAESLLEVKEEVWKSFSSDWKLENIDQNIKNISLDELPTEIEKILKGKQIGRVRVVYD